MDHLENQLLFEKNSFLQKELAAKNRELEVEAALERVRQVAMSMMKTDDLLNISKALFSELKLLGFDELRNAIINTFFDHKSTFLDYDYSDFSGGNITELPYDSHPLLKKYIDRIQSSTDAFAEMIVEQNELESWKENRKKYGKSYDPRLENISALYYYFYSIGGGAIGISTFTSITVEKRNILRKFRNVFDLGYRRYIDIANAEAQAREAKIQLALERVRARTMAMQHSDELKDVANLLFQQVHELGIPAWSCGFNIWEKDEKVCTGWMSTEGFLQPPFKIPLNESPTFIHFYESRQRGESFYSEQVSGQALTDHYNYMLALPDFADIAATHFKAGFLLPTSQIHYVANFSHGNLIFITSTPVSEAKEIFIRFAKVFEQTYTRFLDLQKAEAQAREAQIELGLERVRARAMAMRNSEELKELIGTVFIELTKLDLVLTRCLIMIYDPKTNDSTWWMANSETPSDPIGLKVQYHGHAPYLAYLKAWHEKQLKWTYPLEGEIKKQWDDFLFVETELSHLPDFVIAGMKAPGKVYLNASFNTFGNLTLATLEPLSDEHFGIMLRFAKVFDLTYTRFNDLQKAEAQAREAQIELGLERVRARAMAMQKSDELADAAQLLYHEFGKLGINTFSCGYMFIDEQKQTQTAWVVLPDGSLLPNFIVFPLTGDPVLDSRYKAWQEKKTLHIFEIQGEANKQHHKFLSSHVPSFVVENIFSKIPDRIIFHCANFSDGYLLILATEFFSPEEQQTIIRFAKVFEMTYTRFNDLKQAEAQAREGQIQLALERIRSRTMAMQKSDELTEVAGLLFKQVNDLGIKTWTTGFNVWTDDNNYYEDYITSPQGGFVKPYVIDATQFPAFQEIRDAKKRGEEFFVQFLEGEMLKETYLQLSKFGDERQYEIMLKDGFKFPTHQFDHFVFGSKVSLMFITYEAVPEAHDIFKRLGKVFEQTYTRFLDLQKAEAQAREAKIEVALEKVRSRSLAMYKSDELNEVVLVVFEKLKELNVVTDGVALINLYTEGTKDIVQWMANPELMTTGKYNLPYFDHPIFNNSLEAKKRGKDFNVHTYSFEEKNSFFEYCFRHTDYKYFPDILKKKLLESEAYTHAVAFGKYSAIVVSTLHKKEFSPEAIETMKRFSRVFEQSYIRFLDLLTAEANTKEAVKQAALDRIRAEIASMRTVTDLDRITPLIWNELTILGVPFIRCGVFIMDEEQEIIHTFLSTPDGKAIAAFQLAYATSENISEVIKRWRKKEIYCDHWDQETFRELANGLEKKGEFISSRDYISTLPAGDFYLHFVPFLQGMLYVGNTTPLGDTDKQLIQSVADAFSTAYARYEDFNKLEEAKKQVDKTLLELQSTQKQLIQSEKMASLGELTAGIAHEIQNPLNFVNNFSDVNKELLEELKGEIEKGNVDEVRLIANDVIENEEKINHHGKRADAIVKGMLQHSRKSSGQKESTDVNALADEYLRLSYHGLRAKDKSFGADLKTDFDESIGKIDVIPQDIGRVILNIFNNAFYATSEKQKIEDAKLNADYKPLVSVETKKLHDKIEMKISDNGNGISQNIIDKIFQPFFTTKPAGDGTGLGLSLAYDIIKAHEGELRVESTEGEGSVFTILLPLNKIFKTN